VSVGRMEGKAIGRLAIRAGASEGGENYGQALVLTKTLALKERAPQAARWR